MPHYKLTYFNGRGRAETIRYVFAAAGIPYEDNRIEKPSWPALKPHTPWGTLPILDVDGRTLGQSISIARFVAREGGLMGRNPMEGALVESVTDVITELREKKITMNFSPDGPAKDAALKEFLDKTLPTILPNLERYLASNPEHSGYFVGRQLSLADIHFYAVMEMILPNIPNIFANHPTLRALFERVGSTPRIAEYMKRRPVTQF